MSDKICADYIVEQGNDGIWTWRKWESGIAECWCQYTREGITSLTQWGEIYYAPIVSENDGRIDYPFSFVESPNEQARLSGNFGLITYTQTNGKPTATQTGIYHLARGTVPGSSSYSIDCVLDIYTIGKWK